MFATVILLTGGACAALAAPRPRPYDLALVVNNTACPTAVDYDIDSSRIPRVIKIIKCQPNPDEVCEKQRSKEKCCRRRYSDNSESKCVDVTDTVLVASAADVSQDYTIQVTVGCACMLQEATRALDVS